jgi:hypothetical protein
MAQDEKISPEEKLLKVIKGDGAPAKGAAKAVASPAAAPGPAPVAVKAVPVAVPVVPVAPAAAKPKLAVARSEAAPKPAAAPVSAPAAEKKAEPVPTRTAAREHGKNRGRSSAGMIGSSTPPMRLPQKAQAGRPGLRLVNRALALAALVMLVLAGADIYASVTGMKSAAIVPETGLNLQVTGDEVPVPPLAEILQSAASRNMFGVPKKAATVQVVTQVQPAGPDWKEFVDKNLNMVGVSDLPEGGKEAVVVDASNGKMRLLTTGQSVSVGAEGKQVQLTVETIADDHLVVSDGKDKVMVR